MRISLPHKYRTRLFAGIAVTAFSLGCGFVMAAPVTSTLPQTWKDSGAETPPTPEAPPPPRPRPPA